MKIFKPTSYSKTRYNDQATSRLINIQKENMAKLEAKLGINCTTRKQQHYEVKNSGVPISDEQIKKQNKAIDRLTNIKSVDFTLETNNQKIIETYTKLKRQWRN